MRVTRRQFLTRSGKGVLGAGVAAAFGLPLSARASAGEPGSPAGGPLAHVYGSFGTPRGRVLSFVGHPVVSTTAGAFLTEHDTTTAATFSSTSSSVSRSTSLRPPRAAPPAR